MNNWREGGPSLSGNEGHGEPLGGQERQEAISFRQGWVGLETCPRAWAGYGISEPGTLALQCQPLPHPATIVSQGL